MRRSPLYLLLCLAIGLSSLSPADEPEVGMSRAEILELLGQPSGAFEMFSSETLEYPGYTIKLKNGTVKEITETEIDPPGETPPETTSLTPMDEEETRAALPVTDESGIHGRWFSGDEESGLIVTIQRDKLQSYQKLKGDFIPESVENFTVLDRRQIRESICLIVERERDGKFLALFAESLRAGLDIRYGFMTLQQMSVFDSREFAIQACRENVRGMQFLLRSERELLRIKNLRPIPEMTKVDLVGLIRGLGERMQAIQRNGDPIMMAVNLAEVQVSLLIDAGYNPFPSEEQIAAWKERVRPWQTDPDVVRVMENYEMSPGSMF